MLAGLGCLALSAFPAATPSHASDDAAVSGPVYYGYQVDSLLEALSSALTRAYSSHLPDGKYLAHAMQSLEVSFELDMGYEEHIAGVPDEERLGRGIPFRTRPGRQGMTFKSDSTARPTTAKAQLSQAFHTVYDLNLLLSACRSDEKEWNQAKAQSLLSRLPGELEARKLRVLTVLKANQCVSDTWFNAAAYPLASVVAAAVATQTDEELLLSISDLLRGGFGAYITAEHVSKLIEGMRGDTDERYARRDIAMLEAYSLASLIAAHDYQAAESRLLKHGRTRYGASVYCDDPEAAPPGEDLSMCEANGGGQ